MKRKSGEYALDRISSQMLKVTFQFFIKIIIEYHQTFIMYQSEAEMSQVTMGWDYFVGVMAFTVKPVLSGHSKYQIMIFKTYYRLKKVKRIAECSKGSILHYIRPSLSYHLSLRYLFCLFLSGHLRQVLLYLNKFGRGPLVRC